MYEATKDIMVATKSLLSAMDFSIKKSENKQIEINKLKQELDKERLDRIGFMELSENLTRDNEHSLKHIKDLKEQRDRYNDGVKAAEETSRINETWARALIETNTGLRKVINSCKCGKAALKKHNKEQKKKK